MQQENQFPPSNNVSSCQVLQITNVKRVVKQIVASRDAPSNLKQTRVGLEFIPGLHVEFEEKTLKQLHDELDKIQEHLDSVIGIKSNVK